MEWWLTISSVSPIRRGPGNLLGVADRRLIGPPRTFAATYRSETRVRKHAGNPKRSKAFTVPRAVEFR
jgi:hypothetical protein